MRVLVTLLGAAAAVLGLGALWVGWSGSYVSRWDEFRGVMARLEFIAAVLMIGFGMAGAILIWVKPRLAPLLLALCAGAGVLGALITVVGTQAIGARHAPLFVIALSGGASAVPAAIGAWLALRARLIVPSVVRPRET